MPGLYKKLVRYLLNIFLGKLKYQGFFDKIHNISLRGMNLGTGGNPQESGEIFVLEYIRKYYQSTNRDNMVIFDVGANVGNYSKLVLNTFKSGRVSVLSFEPSSIEFAKLKQNLQNHSNVQLYNSAFSDKDGEATLFSGVGSLHHRRLEHFGGRYKLGQEQKVTIVKLDDFCSNHQISHINFLKIDTEGHELKILEGGKSMLDNNAIDFIQFEFGGCNIDSRTYFQDFFYLLNRKYRIYRILKDGLYPIDNYKETHEVFTTTNFLAERRSKPNE